MAISSWDDFPVHQTSEYVRHVATSDRNFYDRYYFNLHGSSDEVMTIFGLGLMLAVTNPAEAGPPETTAQAPTGTAADGPPPPPRRAAK